MATKKNNQHRHESPRAVRSVRPTDHDHRQGRDKAVDSFVCDDCGVVQHGGRWHWGAPALGLVNGGLCPACKCIHDRRPLGTLRVPMRLVDSTNEVMEIVRTAAAAEREDHPLERIMDIVERGGELVVTTTGMHLARRLAARLERRFHAKPKIHYGEDDEVTVSWQEKAPAPRRGRAAKAPARQRGKGRARKGAVTA